MENRSPRERLAERIAGEIVRSEDPGATIRKWRTEFDATQTDLADQLDISSSVISDYESGRRDNPGIRIVGRLVDGLLALDEGRGGERIRQYERVLTAGFDDEIVHDLREYSSAVPVRTFYDAIGATEITRGTSEDIKGHTVIDSIEAITRLSSDDFYRLYGQSTERALVFTRVTRGESPLVAMRVVPPKPNAVVLHGLDQSELWDGAAALAKIDGVSLAVTNRPLDDVLEAVRRLPNG